MKFNAPSNLALVDPDLDFAYAPLRDYYSVPVLANRQPKVVEKVSVHVAEYYSTTNIVLTKDSNLRVSFKMTVLVSVGHC